MRIFSAVLVCAFGFATGWFCRRRLEQRAEVSESLCAFIRYVRPGMLCLKKSLPQLLPAGPEAFGFAENVIGYLEEGADFYTAWEKGIHKFLLQNPMSDEQGQMLLQFAPAVSGADYASAERILDWYEERMEYFLSEDRQRVASTGKMSVRIGGMVGLLAGILIL